MFGTVLNRFIMQAVVGVPLTLYGKENEVRGFLNIRDTLRCIELAARNPAEPWNFQVFNQFTEQFSMRELADAVADVGRTLGYAVEIAHIENPRVEAEEHYYNAKHQALRNLGPHPAFARREYTRLSMIEAVARHRDRVDPFSIAPNIGWCKKPELSLQAGRVLAA